MKGAKKCLLSIDLSAAPWVARSADVDAPSPHYVTSMQTVDAAALLNNVAMGRSLTLENVVLDGEGTAVVTLELERFQVFAPDAKIVGSTAGVSSFTPPISIRGPGS